MNMLATSGFQYALQVSSTPGVVIVFLLGLLSVVAWSVMVTKMIVVRKAAKQNARFFDFWRKSGHPLEAYASGTRLQGTPAFRVYVAGARETCLQVTGSDVVDDTFPARLRNAERIGPGQLEPIHNAMQRSIGEMALQLESRMNILATAVSGAPFLGLLGTVWGVMDTFAAVASGGAGGASIQVMAPGVAAALVTTVVGLLIALPSMFGYNLLITRIKTMVMELDHFASELLAAFERRHVEHSRDVSSSTLPHTQPPAPPPTTQRQPSGHSGHSPFAT